MSEYRAVNSPLKFLVLDLVDERGDLTYHQLAEATGMPQTYAADRLLKYAHKGLLHRDREGSAGLSTYTLSRHGRDRLQWFRRQ